MSCDTTKQWYLSGEPWFSGDAAGTLIYAGSPDPHAGKIVVDVMPEILFMDIHDYETECEVREYRRTIARHIVELHNSSIDNI